MTTDFDSIICAHGYINGVGCKDCVEEAKRREEEANRLRLQEQQQREREIRDARNAPIYQGLVEAVKKDGHEVSYDAENHKFLIDGVNVTYLISIDERRERVTSWRSRPTGKYNLIIGDYGNRTVYPQKKDGSFSFGKAALPLIGYAEREKVRRTSTAIVRARTAGVEALRQELGLKDYGSGMLVDPSASEKPVAVTVTFKRNMTPDEARKLHAVLKAAGVI